LKIKYFSVSLILFFLILSHTTLAQFPERPWEDIIKIIFGPEVPDEWLEPYKVMQYLIFPFIALWLVVFGILTELRIFRRKDSINAFLAFLIAMIAGPTGYLVLFVRGTFQVLGWLGFSAFGFLMFFGIILWAGVRLWEWGAPWTTKAARKRALEAFAIERKIGMLRDRYNEQMAAGRYADAENTLKKIFELQDQLREMRKEKTEQAGGDETPSYKK
jgi:hypothetical protein